MWHSLKAANGLAPNAGVCKKGNSTDEILNGQQRELKEELVVETMVATNLDAIHPQANYCHHDGCPRSVCSAGGGRRNSNQRNTAETAQCTTYGRGKHPREKCPARDAKCHNCQRTGHFNAQCYSRPNVISSLQEEEPEESVLDSAFLDTVCEGKTKSWMISISLNGWCAGMVVV